MKNKFLVFATIALNTLYMADSQACTRAFMNTYPGYMVTARNFDYFGPANPSLIITPRDINHSGDSNNLFQWKTKYGSVVVYADGLFPMDGINEKGLAGHALYYINGEQIQKDNQDKPILESRAWLSYLLDNYATVEEALAGLKNVRLKAVKLPIDYDSDTKHIAIEDVTGDSAIIEIDNGVVNIYHNKDYRVMTNPPSYKKQLENAAKYQKATPDKVPGTQEPDARFARASYYVDHLPKPDNKNQAQGFIASVLNNVIYPIGTPKDKTDKSLIDTYGKYSETTEQNKGIGTYWTTITDLSHAEYHFRSVFAFTTVYVNLSEINFSAGNPVKRIDGLHDYAQKGWQGNILSYAVAQ